MKATFKLGPARRMYVTRLLERGLAGCSVGEVVETIFNRGLQEMVPAEWMLEASDRAAARLKRKRRKKKR
jgi:hypothetical protein